MALIPEDWWEEHSGQSRVLDPNKVEAFLAPKPEVWVPEELAKFRLGQFYKMALISRAAHEEGLGLKIVEVRRDPKTGERQRLTYTLDTGIAGD